MVINEVATLMNGCYGIIDKHGGFQHLQYSPFGGQELLGAFLHELDEKIVDELLGPDHKKSVELARWWDNEDENYPLIDAAKVPDHLQYLVTNREWYDRLIEKERADHHDGKFCWELSCFIDDCRCDYEELPKLVCVPIQYCPFCGAKLPPEFDQENWWEKEFKTFKWYKDHKMGEWADDYVDDCDWTEDDYPPIKDDE